MEIEGSPRRFGFCSGAFQSEFLIRVFWIGWLCLHHWGSDAQGGVAPQNDRFTSPTLLEGDAVSVTATVADATLDISASGVLENAQIGDTSMIPCALQSFIKPATLWWRWKAPRAGVVYLSLAPAPFELGPCSPILRVWYQHQIQPEFPFGNIPNPVVELGNAFNSPPQIYWPILVENGQELTLQMLGEGTVPCTFRLQMASEPGPQILEQPVSTSTEENGSVFLSTRGIGSRPDPISPNLEFQSLMLWPRYQWFFEDKAIADATSCALLIRNVTAETAGKYHVVVSDDFGSVTSHVAVVSMRANASQVAPQLKVRWEETATSPIFTLTGEIGGFYQLEESSDLTNWQPTATLAVAGFEPEDPFIGVPPLPFSVISMVAYHGIPFDFQLRKSAQHAFLRAVRLDPGCEACWNQLFVLQLAKVEWARIYRKGSWGDPTTTDLLPDFASPTWMRSKQNGPNDCISTQLAQGTVSRSPIWPCPWWIGPQGQTLPTQQLPEGIWNGARIP